MFKVGRLSSRAPLLGPAFVAAIAYVDPGNVATNVAAGIEFGFTLVWVVVLANVMAVVMQYLSAKLGLVTGRSLASQIAAHLPVGVRVAYWLQAEIVAIATDLAEVVGGAVALNLLFGLPLVVGAIVTAAVALVVLRVGDVRGQPALERVIMAFLALIATGFLAGLFVHPPSASGISSGLVPRFAGGSDGILLASGIVGATVMPHVVYLHSSLTTSRLGMRGDGLPLNRLLAATRVDVVAALALAGLLNLALLVLGASGLGITDHAAPIGEIHAAISSHFGAGVALLFTVALLCSGLASTSVGSAAGAEVMRGLMNWRIPVLLRRTITVIPALAILSAGGDPGRTLIASQVALSMGIPFALIPLLLLTTSRTVMGSHVNKAATTVVAGAIVFVITALNAVLLWQTFVT